MPLLSSRNSKFFKDLRASPEFKEKFHKSLEKCQAEFHVTPEDIKKMFAEDLSADDENGKCMMGCMFADMGTIQNNEYSVENCLGMNKEKYTDPKDVEKADEVVKACGKEVPTGLNNNCALAYEIIKCYKAEAEKHDLKMPEVF
ncbi:hypothetical protein AAG570_008576 [Ranatra chinensis]|uniref:Uncharacterized protein n=1 Tax=Ranatra chinensis TaxID=642074 RepID=A0ABD0YR98_9HEMI